MSNNLENNTGKLAIYEEDGVMALVKIQKHSTSAVEEKFYGGKLFHEYEILIKKVICNGYYYEVKEGEVIDLAGTEDSGYLCWNLYFDSDEAFGYLAPEHPVKKRWHEIAASLSKEEQDEIGWESKNEKESV